jgi:NAD-dependent deacetylase sirtuin 4
LERPPDPSSFLSSDDTDGETNSDYLQNQATVLHEWIRHKKSIICITGAGMSTDSGIPDYRGNNGSYFRGHKPIIHQEYMTSSYSRKRYWARSLVGYSPFANARPNIGHLALTQLETLGCIGVQLTDCNDYFDQLGLSCIGPLDTTFTGTQDIELPKRRRISIITQNVDTLHSKAGIKHCLHLHGRGDLIKCMNCGYIRDRYDYHNELTQLNEDWLAKAVSGVADKSTELRPDGDAALNENISYDELILPPCSQCGNPIFKTDVVFFGDNIPKHRHDIANAAIDAADGVLCIGTSLTVHSAYRLVTRSVKNGTPVAILNVGETRVEREGVGKDYGLVTKIEAPIGDTLNKVVNMIETDQR